jgi:hypothetical protein
MYRDTEEPPIFSEILEGKRGIFVFSFHEGSPCMMKPRFFKTFGTGTLQPSLSSSLNIQAFLSSSLNIQAFLSSSLKNLLFF